MGRPVSIIMSGYNIDDRLIECLDSIVAQGYFNDNNYEILVGVDGCQHSLDVIIDIYDSYPQLRVFYTKERVGLGGMLNTLVNVAQYDYILKFDMLDVMCQGLMEEVMSRAETLNFVKFRYDIFRSDPDRAITTSQFVSDTSFLFYKEDVVKLGGFDLWENLVEEDIMARAVDIFTCKIDKVLFHKRRRKWSLSSDRRDKWKRIWRGDRVGSITETIAEYNELFPHEKPIEKNPVSIIIAAYKAQDFIQECLDSIYKQTYFMNFDEFEVIVGVDGCEETAKKLREIKSKYRNLRVLMNKENSGVYVTVNTLMTEAKYDTILRFDADDVMKPTMLSKGMFFTKDYDVVMFAYDQFTRDVTDIHESKLRQAHGVIFLKKELFDRAGGFLPWPCAADSEFLARTKYHSSRCKLRSRLFSRRIHPESVTNKKETAYYSDTRKKYKAMIRNYDKDENIKVEKVLTEFTEL